MFKLKKEATEYENKSLRLPKDLIDKVQALANKNNLSFNKVLFNASNAHWTTWNQNKTNNQTSC